MSNAALTWAWSVRLKGSVVAKATLARLADMANDRGECWPSATRVAEDIGSTDRGIRLALVTLEKAGLLTRTGNFGKPNTIVLLVGNPGTQFRPEASSVLKLVPKPRNLVPPTPELTSETPELTSAKPLREPKKESLMLTSPNVGTNGQRGEPDLIGRALDIWNEIIADRMPKPRGMTDSRRTRVRKLISELGGMDGWRGFCREIAGSDFLTGGKFTCGLDWCIKPENALKIREGNYRNRDGAPQPTKLSQLVHGAF